MDYKNGKIYRLVCESGKQYIGSTTQALRKRLWHHRKSPNTMARTFINPIIILIEDYACERKEQLLMRERYWVENTECVNSHRPIISEEERREWFKKYNEKMREKVKCECGLTVSRGQLKRHMKTKKHFNNFKPL